MIRVGSREAAREREITVSSFINHEHKLIIYLWYGSPLRVSDKGMHDETGFNSNRAGRERKGNRENVKNTERKLNIETFNASLRFSPLSFFSCAVSSKSSSAILVVGRKIDKSERKSGNFHFIESKSTKASKRGCLLTFTIKTWLWLSILRV